MAKQKHIIPVRPSDKLELAIESQGSSGDGICKHKGYTLFVPGGIPGDLVFAEVIKITPRFGVTRIIEQRSPHDICQSQPRRHALECHAEQVAGKSRRVS